MALFVSRNHLDETSTMKFLKLLDPWELTKDSLSAAGEQQARALKMFPDLVEQSLFSYWRVGDPIAKCTLRLLLGVEATYNLSHLRMLDLLRDKLHPDYPSGLEFDVFNLWDLPSWKAAANYFPGVDSMVTPPILGFWTFGIHIANLWGHNAVEYILTAFELGVTSRELGESVCPPSRELME